MGNDGQWYFHHPGLHTFDAGKALCRSEGASLLIVETPFKQEMIDRLYGNTSVWLALYDESGSHDYRWMLPDGQTKDFGSYANWAAKEPNNSNEQCVRNQPDGTGWFDVYCTLPTEVVCQKPKTGKTAIFVPTIGITSTSGYIRCDFFSVTRVSLFMM